MFKNFFVSIFCLLFFFSSAVVSFSDDFSKLESSVNAISHNEVENPKQTVYVFASLTCPYCVRMFNGVDNSDIFTENNVEIKWVMLPTDQVTANKIAFVLKENTIDNLRMAFNGDAEQLEEKEYIDLAIVNQNIFHDLTDRPSVPTVMWEKTSTGELEIHGGGIPEESFQDFVDYIFEK